MDDKSKLPEALAALLERYLAGNCSQHEKSMVEQWYASYDDRPEQQPDAAMLDNLYTQLEQRLLPGTAPAKTWPAGRRRRLFWRMAAAAVALLVLCTGVYQWQAYHKKDAQQYGPDVPPGIHKARLIMANGAVVNLSATGNANIGQQGNTQISKQDSSLVYRYAKNAKKDSNVAYNTLQVPRGGQYSLVLPDGTRVWLNAASSLHFPTAFTGAHRKVSLSGEAYFEVAPDAGKPFVVDVGDMQVQVLGTHFNVMAYREEGTVATTLLEGAVKVTRAQHSVTLKPGEQSQWNGSNMLVDQADVEAAVAWKNGLFTFSDTDINTVMRQLARWYDVEIAYEQPVNVRLNGMISRYTNLSQVLKILELTGEARFRLNGKKITVFR